MTNREVYTFVMSGVLTLGGVLSLFVSTDRVDFWGAIILSHLLLLGLPRD